MSRPESGLHARLRAATGAEHQALEDALDWRARVATLNGYRALLVRLYGFHAAWEGAVGDRLADEPFLAPRRRLGLLVADLVHLGVPVTVIDALPRPAPVPLDGEAGAMGALYVLEGSTLGGQVVGRHIAGLHGLSDGGLAYYRAHGPRAGAMWAAFRARLDGFLGDEAALVAAAVATFRAMRLWLCADAEADGFPHRVPDRAWSETNLDPDAMRAVPSPSAGEGGPRVSEGRERGSATLADVSPGAAFPDAALPSPDPLRAPPSPAEGGGNARVGPPTSSIDDAGKP